MNVDFKVSGLRLDVRSVVSKAAVSTRPQLLPLEEDLRRCRREQQEAQQRGRQLEQKMKELEERSTAAVGDRERQVKLMEVKEFNCLFVSFY